MYGVGYPCGYCGVRPDVACCHRAADPEWRAHDAFKAPPEDKRRTATGGGNYPVNPKGKQAPTARKAASTQQIAPPEGKTPSQNPNTDLLAEINAFVTSNAMPPSVFGYGAIGDRRLIHELKAGRQLKPETIERIRTFMANPTKAQQ